jgi:hypothetical protein
MQPKRSLILYPVLLVFYFYLLFYSINSTTMLFPMEAFLKYLALSLAGAAALWSGLAWLWKDAAKAAVLVAFLVFLAFSYGHVYDLVYFRKTVTALYVASQAVLIRSHLVILFAWALLAAAAVMLTIARGDGAYRLTSSLNIVTAVLCAFPIVTIAAKHNFFSGLTASAEEDRAGAAEAIPISASAEGYDDTLPDIYYIILDAYVRDDMLQTYYGYHNTFVDYLEARGFYVAPESTANYPITFQALPSSLNMHYVTDADVKAGGLALQGYIKDPVICRTMREIGYQYISMETIITGVSTCADTHVASAVNNLDVIFLKTTLARPFLNQSVWAKPTYQNHLDRVDALLKIPEIEGPTFTFAHFILPHDPYVFDRDGNQVFQDYPMGTEAANRAYLEQLIYTNTLFTHVVDTLLAESDVPPIIIIQGDHGSPWAMSGTRDNPDYLRTRYTILNAYYFPYGGEDALYPSISPVNSFRVMLNYYFDAQLDLLPDESYFWVAEENRFVQITVPED